jgi:hypothetical protein
MTATSTRAFRYNLQLGMNEIELVADRLKEKLMLSKTKIFDGKI